jgi:hypothetical protein
MLETINAHTKITVLIFFSIDYTFHIFIIVKYLTICDNILAL